MAAIIASRFKVSAQDATTVTLVPKDGYTTKGDTADKITQIVLTFASARDNVVFDIVGREFALELERR